MKKKASYRVFAKISVKGDDIHPFYKFLTSKETNPRFSGDVRWNFDKFLLDSKGDVAARFEPKADPIGKDVIEAVEKALKEKK